MEKVLKLEKKYRKAVQARPIYQTIFILTGRSVDNKLNIYSEIK